MCSRYARKLMILATALGILSVGVAQAQTVGGQFILDAPAPLVPIVPVVSQSVVVQPAPYVVQRPTIIPRAVPVVVTPAPVVVGRPIVAAYPSVVSRSPVITSAPVVTHRIPVEATVVGRPVTESTTVWYSAPADVAPTLSTTPISAVTPVPVIVGTAPTVVYSPVVAVPVRTYVVGSGSLGQPKLYVPGQPVRNAVRYLTP